MNGCYFRNELGDCDLRKTEPRSGCAKRKKGDLCGLTEHTEEREHPDDTRHLQHQCNR